MTKQEALNKAAKEAGYDDFDGAKRYAISDEINSIIRNAMDIYAKEQYNQAIRDAAENAEIAQECGEYKPYCNKPNCDNCNKVVSKQSILKLLK